GVGQEDRRRLREGAGAGRGGVVATAGWRCSRGVHGRRPERSPIVRTRSRAGGAPLMRRRLCRRVVLAGLAGLAAHGAAAKAQASNTKYPAEAPATKEAVGPFDVGLVKRAEALLSSPQKWNRVDTGRCPRADTMYSVRCALERAIVEGAGLRWDPRAAPKTTAANAPLNCAMDVSTEHPGGSCGLLWDELPIFTLERVNAVTSGVWRRDATPLEVWAGKMADAEGPVHVESRKVEMVSRRKAPDQLIDFNNDSTTTFDQIRSFFRTLETQVLENGAADLGSSSDDVEIEIYPGGTGVIRTYNGWFPVTAYRRSGSSLY